MRRFVNLTASIVILLALVVGAFAAARALTAPQHEDVGPGLVVDDGTLPALPGDLNAPGSGDKASYSPPINATEWPVSSPAAPSSTDSVSTEASPSSVPTAPAQTRAPPQTKAPVAPLPPSPADDDDDDDDDDEDDDDDDEDDDEED
ncbi:hypothetical protein ACTXOR_02605 [Arthrobacter rhombi]|uniref:hypothetical protein n=1 Tax=Arthrobacter rhombi TaxID=71253 RepID=UPI003FD2DCBA